MTDMSAAQILIAEDEVNLAELYAKWLRPRHAVTTAYDGSEALDALDNTIDVVLLDRRMPGSTGDEVLGAIRDGELDCQVVMVTAVEPNVDVLDLGFDDYLIKPVSETDLQRSVDQMLTRASYNAQMRDYFALVSKRAVLTAELDSETLDANEEFVELEREIAGYETRLEADLSNFDDADFRAVLRDLSTRQSRSAGNSRARGG